MRNAKCEMRNWNFELPISILQFEIRNSIFAFFISHFAFRISHSSFRISHFAIYNGRSGFHMMFASESRSIGEEMRSVSTQQSASSLFFNRRSRNKQN